MRRQIGMWYVLLMVGLMALMMPMLTGCGTFGGLAGRDALSMSPGDYGAALADAYFLVEPSLSETDKQAIEIAYNVWQVWGDEFELSTLKRPDLPPEMADAIRDAVGHDNQRLLAAAERLSRITWARVVTYLEANSVTDADWVVILRDIRKGCKQRVEVLWGAVEV